MNLSGYSSDNVPNGGQRILSVWPWEAGMRHQPAGEGLHHFAEALIRGHTFREKGVGHQQRSQLVANAIQLFMDLTRECCGSRPNGHLKTVG